METSPDQAQTGSQAFQEEVESERRRGRGTVVGKSGTCRGCCGKAKEPQRRLHSGTYGESERILLFLCGPHSPAETQGLTENS